MTVNELIEELKKYPLDANLKGELSVYAPTEWQGKRMQTYDIILDDPL